MNALDEGYRRLALAVVLQAYRDLSSPDIGVREDAERFFENAESPWILFLDAGESTFARICRAG